MNTTDPGASSDPGDDALSDRFRSLPSPRLREVARRRSLDAALAAVGTADGPHAPGYADAPESGGEVLAADMDGGVAAARRGRTHRMFHRISPFHAAGLAACWILTGYFHYSQPGSPENSGAVPADGYASWPGALQPAPEGETAELLAALYPGRSYGGSWRAAAQR